MYVLSPKCMNKSEFTPFEPMSLLKWKNPCANDVIENFLACAIGIEGFIRLIVSPIHKFLRCSTREELQCIYMCICFIQMRTQQTPDGIQKHWYHTGRDWERNYLFLNNMERKIIHFCTRYLTNETLMECRTPFTSGKKANLAEPILVPF